MKLLYLFLISTLSFTSFSQDVQDLFKKSDTPITWLGIDFSHVKLIGDFNQFGEWGDNGSMDIKATYFPAWNDFVYSEPDKYNVSQMLRKEQLKFETDYIYSINKQSSIEDMESKTDPNYTHEDIQNFIKKYDFKTKNGIGILLVAESLNKFKEYGKYHFVAIDLKNNSILIHETITGKSGGFGLKNYWAKTFYNVIQEITKTKYAQWKQEFLK